MEVTRLGNWYIKNNELSISFMNYYVLINISNEDYLLYNLNVLKDGKEILTFIFYTLEEAVDFTENVIKNSKCEEEILNAYLMILRERKLIKR